MAQHIDDFFGTGFALHLSELMQLFVRNGSLITPPFSHVKRMLQVLKKDGDVLKEICQEKTDTLEGFQERLKEKVTESLALKTECDRLFDMLEEQRKQYEEGLRKQRYDLEQDTKKILANRSEKVFNDVSRQLSEDYEKKLDVLRGENEALRRELTSRNETIKELRKCNDIIADATEGYVEDGMEETRLLCTMLKKEVEGFEQEAFRDVKPMVVESMDRLIQCIDGISKQTNTDE